MATTETFQPILSFEPAPDDIVQMLATAVGPIAAMVSRVNEIDVKRGAGVVSPLDKCLWTRDGCRVTVSIVDAGLILSCSKVPDPAAPMG